MNKEELVTEISKSAKVTKKEAEAVITRHLKLKCLTLKIKNFKFASNLRENF